MKQIKFRAWDRDSETFFYSDKPEDERFFEFDKGILTAFILVETPGTIDEPSGMKAVPLDSIDQYTGLKDKNGKEIYEEDIVKASNWEDAKTRYHPRPKKKDCEGVFIIESSLTGWGYEFDWIHLSGYECSTHIMGFPEEGDSQNIEIIGNIYENPELLKGRTP